MLGIVLVGLFAGTGANAQTPAKHRNLFDDNPPPSNTPDSAKPNPAGANALAPGWISTVYANAETEGRIREHDLVPGLGLVFNTPLGEGYVPLSFAMAGVLNVPASGIKGAFRFECSGSSELTIDGTIVTATRHGDPANSFVHNVNLAAGVHSLSLRVFHLPGTGQPQRITLFWHATGADPVVVPKEWCWHAKADEPPGVVKLKVEGQEQGTASGGVTWVKPGSPRPFDPSAKLDDLMAGLVLESFAGPAFEHFNFFTATAITDKVNFTVDPHRMDANGVYQESIKIVGTIRIDAECQCMFDAAIAGQLSITIDGRAVTRTGAQGEQPVHEATMLKPGVHPFELALSHISAPAGRYPLTLLWKKGNEAFEPVPTILMAHYRSQEPYGDSTASVPAGQPAPAPQPVQQPVVPPVQPPTVPPVRTVRLPVPDTDAQARAVSDLRQRVAEWNQLASAQQADFLIRAADQNREDAVASYVLLDKARQQAQSAASIAMAFRAIDILASQYAVDATRMKVGVLQFLGARRVSDPSSSAALASVFEQAMAADNFAAAADAATMSLADARARNSPADIQVATAQVSRATSAAVEVEKIKPMLSRLADNPNDPAANLAAGQFYCFTARNWARGAAALARTNDPVFSWLGKHEATATQSPTAQLVLANGWWDAADGRGVAQAAAMRERAAQWYNLVAPNLAGLSRRLAEKRIAKIPSAAILPSPLGAPIPDSSGAPVLSPNPPTHGG